MNTEEDILIQKFLKNTLSEKERNEVLLRMEKDKNFCEKVNLEEQLFLNLNTSEWSISTNSNHPEVKEYEDLLKSDFAHELKDTLKSVNTDYQIKQRKKGKSWLLFYSGVAVAAILIGLTIFSPKKVSNNELYTTYLNLSELPSLVNRGNSNQKTLIKAQKLFETKKYNQSLSILEHELSSLRENKAVIYLYTGISQMELGKFDEAEITFNTLIESKFIDSPKGQWYKALLFIKKNDLSKAKKILYQITRSSSNYKFKEALELLDRL